MIKSPTRSFQARSSAYLVSTKRFLVCKKVNEVAVSPEMQVKPGAFSSTLSTTSDLPSGSTKATTVDNTIASSGDNYMDKEVPSDDDML